MPETTPPRDEAVPTRARRIAIVVPYGSTEGAFFGELLEARMCEEARVLGHEARLVRVYFGGGDGEEDAAVGERLRTFLEQERIDLVVTERLYDPTPVRRFRADQDDRRVLLLAQGEVPRALEGIDAVLGDFAGRVALPRSDVMPADMMLDAWERALAAIAGDRPLDGIPGVSVVRDGRLVGAPPYDAPSRKRPFRAATSAEVIALRPPPPIRHRTLFGTYGCPYSGDPMRTPHYAGVRLPTDRPVARLGCAFCHMGGDYTAGPDAAIVADLVEQASHWTTHEPDVDRLLLADQHPMRYLGALLEAAHARSIRPSTWLFAARADAFLRERDALEAAIAVAERVGHRLEVYLTGFESFSDDELIRYHKGVTVRDQLDAVAAMRRLHASHPRSFAYAEAKGHSLILWNPWTQPSDLEASAATVRENGLRELFHELGRNRLRLHPNLPIHHAAARDGALLPSWDASGEGAARAKGYGDEHPWRFLDPRTGRAYALARALRAELGVESELAQLLAIARHVVAHEPAGEEDEPTRCLDAARRLRSLLVRPDATSGAAPVANLRTGRVHFAGACNNGCRSCANRDRYLPDDEASLRQRLASARDGSGAVVFLGREPTLHPRFLALVSAARGDDARPVGLVTNGRRFAYARFARATRLAGVSHAWVKVFGATDATADAHARVEGAHAQALDGLRHLRDEGVPFELLVTLHEGMLGEATALADLARASGAQGLRIEVPIDGTPIARWNECADAVEALVARCEALGLPCQATRLGTVGFDRMPVRR